MTRFPVFLPTVVLALAVPTLSPSQTTTPAPPAEPSLRTFFKDLAGDVRRLPSNPAAISIAAGSILSTSVHPLDDNLAEWVPADAFEPGNWAGNPAILAAGTLLTYGVGHWTDKPRVRHIAADLLRAQTLSLVVVHGMKLAIDRERPDHTSADSFPSGHAAQTFASATVLARHYGARAAWPAYGAATFVALSRVNQHRHFLSDVMFGAGLGVAIGWNNTHRTPPWIVTPAASRSGVTVQVSRRFEP